MRLFLTMVASALLVLPAGAAELDSVVKDIVGVWQLDFTDPDNVKRTPIILVGREQEKLVAWQLEDEELVAFEDVCLEEDVVVGIVKPKEFDGDLTVTLKAQLDEEGVCSGKAKYEMDGDSGDFEFTGKRFAWSEFDELTQWELAFTTPEYERENALVRLVTVDDKVYGWYSSKAFELPIMKVDTKGGKLLLSITARTMDGTKVDVTFRGTVEGDSVTGNAEYKTEDDSGSFPFTAKLKSE